MTFLDGCHSLKLECALRNLGFIDIGWKCVAHAGLFFIEPYAIEENPDADLLGFNIKRSKNIVKLIPTAKRALDFALDQKL